MSSRISHTDLQMALPDVASTLHLPGLQQPVDICRDQWGIPHIRTENEHDAFFAQGFVTAQIGSGIWTTTAIVPWVGGRSGLDPRRCPKID